MDEEKKAEALEKLREAMLAFAAMLAEVDEELGAKAQVALAGVFNPAEDNSPECADEGEEPKADQEPEATPEKQEDVPQDEGEETPQADEEPEPEPEPAALKKEEKPAAEDSAAIRRKAVEDVRKHMQALYAAATKVRPLCGELNAMSFDSANGIYGHALKSAGIDPKKYAPAAWSGMVEVLLRKNADFKPPVNDCAIKKDFSGHFSNLKNIEIS